MGESTTALTTKIGSMVTDVSVGPMAESLKDSGEMAVNTAQASTQPRMERQPPANGGTDGAYAGCPATTLRGYKKQRHKTPQPEPEEPRMSIIIIGPRPPPRLRLSEVSEQDPPPQSLTPPTSSPSPRPPARMLATTTTATTKPSLATSTARARTPVGVLPTWPVAATTTATATTKHPAKIAATAIQRSLPLRYWPGSLQQQQQKQQKLQQQLPLDHQLRTAVATKANNTSNSNQPTTNAHKQNSRTQTK
mmetsp:Transcript_53923/g.115145  ORF Transcript_53923/g.115145 Transcript_53923/m.115145 type:complete len:250 (+) Transcript_53923:775-1524(+)